MEEEPPSKVSKFDMSAEYLDESFDDEQEYHEDVQEEWLSEEILTDDDYTAVDKKYLENANGNNSRGLQHQLKKQEAMPDDLNEFLVKKPPAKVDKDKAKSGKKIVVKEKKVVKKKVEDEATEAESSDSGNDTDDLLRMLGDDVKKNIKDKDGSKKKLKGKKPTASGESSEDDFSHNKTKLGRLKAASKNVKKAAIAEPEESDSYSEMSSQEDDVEDLKKMFEPSRVTSKAGKSKETSASKTHSSNKKKQTASAKEYKGQLRSQRKPNSSDGRRKPSPVSKPKPSKPSPIAKTVLVTKASPVAKSMAGPQSGTVLKLQQIPKPNTRSPLYRLSPKSSPKTAKPSSKPNAFAQKVRVFKQPNQGSPKVVLPKASTQRKVEFDEIINEDDYHESDDDDFDLDDELGMNSDEDLKGKLRLMEPEKMDEEMPSDFDSSEDDSYSEIPSSDSEDDWFTIDLRTEKASDYLPLLGSKAYDVLSLEKERIGVRLRELKKSVRALSDSSKRQADQVREATAALGEIEAMIKAA